MARPRKQTYTLRMYLEKIKDGDICNDADVQRNFVWKKEQVNELVVTVLTDDYIPPIILGEEDNTQLHIADGGQRSAALNWFRNGNYKITSAIENPVIGYKKKERDDNGHIIWMDAEFNIKNKTFEQLPDELKKKFDEYQIETVIHEDCDRYRISKYIKRYNNTTSMTAAQKAFTYVYNFAEYIREILDCNFFIDHSAYTDSNKTKGDVERVVIESVMCMFHLEHWKTQPKQIASYLNENSSKEEFEHLENNLHRLEKIVTTDIKDVFNCKDSLIWLTLFDKFTKLGLNDDRFADFLREFKSSLRNKMVNGSLFDTADKGVGTKDKATILKKLNIVETLMYEFLGFEKAEMDDESLLSFVQENVSEDVSIDDINFYEEMLEDLTLNVDNNSVLLNKCNNPSLIAMVGYGCLKDVDLDDWIVSFFNKNKLFIPNQRENYIFMKNDLNEFIARRSDC